MATLTNWAKNVVFTAAELLEPTSMPQLQQLVASHDRLRVLGTGHSFNRIADSPISLLSVRSLPRVLELDSAAATVRVSAGTRYGELAPFLDQHGFALSNLGSLPHISVAGACATGTHGSGNANQVLAAAVRAQQLVRADGELVELTVADAGFAGSVVALGALGVVTELTLALVPAFQLRQYVYDDLSLATLADGFEQISAAAYSVSAFTRWRDGAQLWLKSEQGRADEPFFGARPATGTRHPLPDGDLSSATEQLGVPGPWQQRLPHFRLEFTPSSGAEIQSEYFVDRALAAPAFAAVQSMAEQLQPVLQISEIRTIAADELWLSPCYGRDRVALHFTWIRDEAALIPVLRELESRLAEFDAVPHWGKYFLTAPDRLAQLHPELGRFAALMAEHDPSGTFTNEFVRRTVLGEQS
ncbi:MAG TPA: FAD-binding protein [Jatrophihabitans sp.]|nr:FAD-binding protein [Jatrophihabitans sp.]